VESTQINEWSKHVSVCEVNTNDLMEYTHIDVWSILTSTYEVFSFLLNLT